jgi:hypothetical protein
MKLLVVGAGLAGKLPSQHEYEYLCELAETSATVPMPAMLRNELKIRTIMQAAAGALAPLNGHSELLEHGGCILTTRWDGRFPTMSSEENGAILSTTELSPSSVALSLVPHVAQSCIPRLLKLHGPSMTISSRQGLRAALTTAAMYLARYDIPLMLAEEFDLALPRNLRESGEEPQESYAIGLIVARQSWEFPVLGEINI